MWASWALQKRLNPLDFGADLISAMTEEEKEEAAS